MSTSATPTRISEQVESQHMSALARANRIRLVRAKTKRQIAEGSMLVADIVENPAEELGGIELTELLGSQKRWGAARCRKFMDSIGLAEHKTVASLTERQREAMVAVLRSSSPTSEMLEAVSLHRPTRAA